MAVNATFGAASSRGFGMFSGVEAPPVTSGLVGFYPTESFTGSSWLDLSGNNNHAAAYNSPTVATNSAQFGSSRTFRTVQINANQGIIWPTAILPSTYTLFYVARYNTSNTNTPYIQKNYNKLDTSATGMSQAFYPNAGISGGVYRVPIDRGGMGDSIWFGSYGFIDSMGISANKSYIMCIDAKATSDQVDSTSGQVWDSAVYDSQFIDYVRMKTDYRFNHIKFSAGNTFALGNRWMRGLYNNVFSANTFGYFRNYYGYEITEPDCHQIFAGYNRAWYSGFFAGRAGSAYHGQELVVNNVHSNNWVLGTDSNNNGSGGQLFRTNKLDRFNAANPSGTETTFAQLAINYRNYGTGSSDAPELNYAAGSKALVSEVVVYNRALSNAEYVAVENYLSSKYGVA